MDALTCSQDISDGKLLESGHLLWRPTAWAYWIGLGKLGSSDPPVAFRLLSALATAVLCVLTYGIARRLHLPAIERVGGPPTGA